MAKDIPSDIQALAVGFIFLFIGIEIFIMKVIIKSQVTFIHSIG